MIKILRMVRKAKLLTSRQFKQSWLAEMAPVAKGMLDANPIDRIVVSFATGEMVGGEQTPFDAMLEIYVRNAADKARVIAALGSDAIKRGEAKLLDESGDLPFLLAEEQLMSENSAWASEAARSAGPGAKVVRTIKRRPDLTLQQFKEYWLNQHSKLEKGRTQSTRVRRIVSTFPLGGPIGAETAEPPFDGMVSLYFENADAAKQQFAGTAPSVMRQDEVNFVDMSVSPVRSITEEYLVAEASG